MEEVLGEDQEPPWPYEHGQVLEGPPVGEVVGDVEQDVDNRDDVELTPGEPGWLCPDVELDDLRGRVAPLQMLDRHGRRV